MVAGRVGFMGSVAECDPRGKCRPSSQWRRSKGRSWMTENGGRRESWCSGTEAARWAEAPGGQGVTRVCVPWSPATSNSGLP